ncbi:MAG: HlyC/CorC family transporter [Planctomycetaceae bacterium]|nr:HlyC/CorC family transporter [Planctomycetaceae bacterium]
MNQLLITAGWSFPPLLLMLLSLICFSLRDFSRSKLEEICEEEDDADRFGRILHNYERVLWMCELAFAVTLFICTLIFHSSSYFGLFVFPEKIIAGQAALVAVRILGLVLLGTAFIFAIPWTLARVTGEAVIYRLWPLLEIATRPLVPVWSAMLKLDRVMHRVFGLPEPDSSEANHLLEDELRAVVDEGHREGVLQSNASRMIHRVVDLQSEDVAAIMTPRTDMVTIPRETVLQEALSILVEQGYSRVPVVGKTIDDVVGILYARDLLAASLNPPENPAEATVDKYAREVLYVPESQGIETLLEKMQQQKVHMAIVVDEYSGVSGLVTLEDIVEEIVGDISDEYDDEEQPMISSQDDGSITVDGRFHIDDLNRELNVELPEDEDFDTIGGFLMSVRGHIPVQGEVIESHGLSFRVVEADERQLKLIQITRLPDEAREG